MHSKCIQIIPIGYNVSAQFFFLADKVFQLTNIFRNNYLTCYEV